MFHNPKVPNRIHLFVADNTVINNHRSEAARLLDPSFYSFLNVSAKDSHAAYRQTLWPQFMSELAVGSSPTYQLPYPEDLIPREGIVFTTLTALAADARTHPQISGELPPMGPGPSLLDGGFVYDTLFVDEVANLRNPQSDASCAMRRLVEQSLVVIAASATPIYTSVLDIVNIGRVLGMPQIVHRLHDSTRPMVIQTHCDDGRLLLDPQTVTKRYYFSHCRPVVSKLAEKAALLMRKLVRSRKNLMAHCKAEALGHPSQAAEDNGLDDVDLPNPEVHLLQIASWNDVVAATNPSDPMETDLVEQIKTLQQEMRQDVVSAIGKLFEKALIRRTHKSLRFDGFPLTSIRPLDLALQAVELTDVQLCALDDYMRLVQHTDGKFRVLSRRYLKDPGYMTHRYHNYWAAPSPVAKALADNLVVWQQGQEGKPTAQQEKAIVYVWWTSLIPNLQAYLASRGVRTATLTGDLNPVARKTVVDAFQQDADHPSPSLVFPVPGQGSLLAVYPASVSRVLIISEIASTGINLQRANRMHFYDIPWSWSQVFQTHGRINRIGQTRPVSAVAYFHPQTFEKDLMTLINVKKTSGESFFAPPDAAALSAFGDCGELAATQGGLTSAQAVIEKQVEVHESRRDAHKAEQLAKLGKLLFVTEREFGSIKLPVNQKKPGRPRAGSAVNTVDVRHDIVSSVLKRMKAWAFIPTSVDQDLKECFLLAGQWDTAKVSAALFRKRAAMFYDRHCIDIDDRSPLAGLHRKAEIYALAVLGELVEAPQRKYRDNILFGLLDAQGFITADTLFAFPGVTVLNHLPTDVIAHFPRSAPLKDLVASTRAHLVAALSPTIGWHNTYLHVAAGLGLATWKPGMATMAKYDATLEPHLFYTLQLYLDGLAAPGIAPISTDTTVVDLVSALHSRFGVKSLQPVSRLAPSTLLGLFVTCGASFRLAVDRVSLQVLAEIDFESPLQPYSAPVIIPNSSQPFQPPFTNGHQAETVVFANADDRDPDTRDVNETLAELLRPRDKRFLASLSPPSPPCPSPRSPPSPPLPSRSRSSTRHWSSFVSGSHSDDTPLGHGHASTPVSRCSSNMSDTSDLILSRKRGASPSRSGPSGGNKRRGQRRNLSSPSY